MRGEELSLTSKLSFLEEDGNEERFYIRNVASFQREDHLWHGVFTNERYKEDWSGRSCSAQGDVSKKLFGRGWGKRGELNMPRLKSTSWKTASNQRWIAYKNWDTAYQNWNTVVALRLAHSQGHFSGHLQQIWSIATSKVRKIWHVKMSIMRDETYWYR